jgi:hypothetical protein
MGSPSSDVISKHNGRKIGDSQQPDDHQLSGTRPMTRPLLTARIILKIVRPSIPHTLVAP